MLQDQDQAGRQLERTAETFRNKMGESSQRLRFPSARTVCLGRGI